MAFRRMYFQVHNVWDMPILRRVSCVGQDLNLELCRSPLKPIRSERKNMFFHKDRELDAVV